MTYYESPYRMKTIPFLPRPLGIIAACCLFTAPWAAADFIAPTDQAPFRTDQLPIDTDAMKQLADDLSILCSSLPTDRAEHLRHSAQFLAIARAVDPSNRYVDDLIEKLEEGNSAHGPGSVILNETKARVWSTHSWLASDEAGKNGNILALCLGDTLAKIDPQHPSAAAYKNERGAWNNWVAPVEAFAPSDKPEIAVVPDTPSEETPDTAPSPEETNDGKEVAFKRQSAVIQSPLWMYVEETSSYVLKLAPVSLSTWTDNEHDRFRYHLKNFDEDRIRPILKSINSSTVPRFEEKFGGLPRGGVVELSLPEKDIYSIRRNGEALSAAAAVLASASISGDEPTGIVIGIVREDGKLALPPNAWELIRSLSSAPSSRIVLPADSTELLLGLLVMDDLAFFMKHDIFFAKDLNELIAFSKKSPDAATSASLASFAAVREKATPSIGPFVSNPAVRTRLETIVAASPQYASAQLLLVQSRGKRPTYLSEKALAHQLRAALTPFDEITRLDTDDDRHRINATLVQSIHDSSRAMLDPMDRMVASTERPLYNEAMALSNAARTLARAIKKVSDRGFDEENIRFHNKSLYETSDIIRKTLPEMQRKIANILGEKVED